MNIISIIKSLDDYIIKNGFQEINPVQANEVLAKAGLLKDRPDRPGAPLRALLRKGMIPHAFQSGGKGTGWTIPHSSKGKRL
jgi:hypothetical protein